MNLSIFKDELQAYLDHDDIKQYFFNSTTNPKKEKIILFGKSMNAIDLPFLTRDLGANFMKYNFHHRVLDLSSTANTLIDMGYLPARCSAGGELMKFLKMGNVQHRALDDATNTAQMYLKLIEQFSSLSTTTF